MVQEPQRAGATTERKEERWSGNQRAGAAIERKAERWSRNHRELEQQPREMRNDGSGITGSWSSNQDKRGKVERELKRAVAATEKKEERWSRNHRELEQ